MMTNNYFEYSKFVDVLSFVLSTGYHFNFSTKAIEKRIIESNYFNKILNDEKTSDLYKSDIDVVKEIYFDIPEEKINFVTYNEIEWASMVYAYLLDKTNYNFETILIYLPIQKVYEMFPVYHEMDINKCLTYFNELKQVSIISKRMKALKLTNKVLSEQTNLSTSSINFLRNRKTDIRKVAFQNAISLAKALKISTDTLLNN
ncbi:MAG: helix-turn-helix transcriptional regulator [Firmicutes bacterium]|nr:helix-turn-helix transcriptional regulator [Candidatus Fiminaster equi]